MSSFTARERSRSPRDRTRHTDDRDSRRRSRERTSQEQTRALNAGSVARLLPFNRDVLTKHDLKRFKLVFSSYLDIQKGLNIADLSEAEVKGRWKSFIGKWNRGELSRGWYDPQTLHRGEEEKEQPQAEQSRPLARRDIKAETKTATRLSDDEDDFGPALPDAVANARHGPSIPNLQDLQHKREIDQEDREDRRKQDRDQRRLERKAQVERQHELMPRAEAGTRERQLENRRETAAANKAFAQAKDAEAVEVGDRDLMGDDDGFQGYKAKLEAQQRQKSEREIRKEEVLRARAAERDERLAAHREKEAKTMETLRMLAEQRYGSIS